MQITPMKMMPILAVGALAALGMAPRLVASSDASSERTETVAVSELCVPSGLRSTRDSVGVCGQVVGAPLAPAGSLSVGCLGSSPSLGIAVDATGHYDGWIPAEPCQLTVFRSEGELIEPGSAVWVSPGEGDVVRPTLWAPDYVPAGFGFEVRVASESRRIEIGRVHPGAPADRMGLRRGDQIVSIDGAPTAGMSEWDFIERGVGRPGTRAMLRVITRRGEQHLVTLLREPVYR